MNSLENFPDIIAPLLFALAIAHTFSAPTLRKLARKLSSAPLALLSHVEFVFGFWAILFLLFIATLQTPRSAIQYLLSCNFSEPVFVFVMMTLCLTRPVLRLSDAILTGISRQLPFKEGMSFYLTCLICGPLLGSWITEPAAMTVTASILSNRFFCKNLSQKLKYSTLGLLFVHISIGGTLTPYAAPPVLMVARLWNWDLLYMMSHFGWKAFVAMALSTGWVCLSMRSELNQIRWNENTKQLHKALDFREGLGVAFFLAGLVVLGGPQKIWVAPLLSGLSSFQLYLGSISLTALIDNAALTYLGAQVPDLPGISRYALVAGSVVGGGLTLIANAPNLVGYGILNSHFGKDGIRPFLLFRYALLPTLIAAVCFWLL